MPRNFRAAFRGIVQTITATNEADGTEPAGSPVVADDSSQQSVKTYTEHTAGGKFDWNSANVNPGRSDGANNGPWSLKALLIKTASACDWTISLSDGTIDIDLITATAETDIGVFTPIWIPPGFFLKVVSSGATAAITMVAWASPGDEATR